MSVEPTPIRQGFGPRLLATTPPAPLPGFATASAARVRVTFTGPVDGPYLPACAVIGSHVLFDRITSRLDHDSLDRHGFVVEITASEPLPAGLGWIVGAAIDPSPRDALEVVSDADSRR